jgi:hypothetical protein
MSNNAASYSGGSRFKSRLWDVILTARRDLHHYLLHHVTCIYFQYRNWEIEADQYFRCKIQDTQTQNHDIVQETKRRNRKHTNWSLNIYFLLRFSGKYWTKCIYFLTAISFGELARIIGKQLKGCPPDPRPDEHMLTESCKTPTGDTAPIKNQYFSSLFSPKIYCYIFLSYLKIDFSFSAFLHCFMRLCFL